MITASVPPAVTTAAAASNIIAQHHPVIKLVIVVALLWFAIGKAEVMWTNHETKVFDAKNAALSAQVQQDAVAASVTAAQAATNAQLAAQYKTLLAQTQAQIAELESQTKQQQVADAAMTPDALAGRWAVLINEADQVHPITGGGYAVSQDAAVATTQALETIPTLNAEVASDSALLSSQTGLLTGDGKQITDLNAQVVGLQKTNADEITTCGAQVAQVRAADAIVLHKSRKKWFLAGLVTGALGSLFLGHSGL